MSLYLKCNHCGDEVASLHRHDYRPCKCGKVAIDGGFDYSRIIGNKGDYTTRTMPPEDYPWGTYGKDGKGPYRTIRLGDAETSHLEAILANVPTVHPKYKEAITIILAERAKKPQRAKRYRIR